MIDKVFLIWFMMIGYIVYFWLKILMIYYVKNLVLLKIGGLRVM